MPRGHEEPVGATRVSQNGYMYEKTSTGWKLQHRVIAEQTLGRELLPSEMVRFVDGDRTNLSPENITVIPSKERTYTSRRKQAALIAKIQELYAVLVELDGEDTKCPICSNE